MQLQNGLQKVSKSNIRTQFQSSLFISKFRHIENVMLYQNNNFPRSVVFDMSGKPVLKQICFLRGFLFNVHLHNWRQESRINPQISCVFLCSFPTWNITLRANHNRGGGKQTHGPHVSWTFSYILTALTVFSLITFRTIMKKCLHRKLYEDSLRYLTVSGIWVKVALK